jgi:hypothetical protein
MERTWIEDICEKDGEENIWIFIGSDSKLEKLA